MKYVMLRSPDGTELPIFCTAPLTHRVLATAFELVDMKPISAGYCRFEADGKVTTADESITLGLKPRPDDAHLLAMFYQATLRLVPAFSAPPTLCPSDLKLPA
jgi:hypothetical protein